MRRRLSFRSPGNGPTSAAQNFRSVLATPPRRKNVSSSSPSYEPNNDYSCDTVGSSNSKNNVPGAVLGGSEESNRSNKTNATNTTNTTQTTTHASGVSAMSAFLGFDSGIFAPSLERNASHNSDHGGLDGSSSVFVQALKELQTELRDKVMECEALYETASALSQALQETDRVLEIERSKRERLQLKLSMLCRYDEDFFSDNDEDNENETNPSATSTANNHHRGSVAPKNSTGLTKKTKKTTAASRQTSPSEDDEYDNNEDTDADVDEDPVTSSLRSRANKLSLSVMTSPSSKHHNRITAMNIRKHLATSPTSLATSADGVTQSIVSSTTAPFLPNRRNTSSAASTPVSVDEDFDDIHADNDDDLFFGRRVDLDSDDDDVMPLTDESDSDNSDTGRSLITASHRQRKSLKPSATTKQSVDAISTSANRKHPSEKRRRKPTNKIGKRTQTSSSSTTVSSTHSNSLDLIHVENMDECETIIFQNEAEMERCNDTNTRNDENDDSLVLLLGKQANVTSPYVASPEDINAEERFVIVGINNNINESYSENREQPNQLQRQPTEDKTQLGMVNRAHPPSPRNTTNCEGNDRILISHHSSTLRSSILSHDNGAKAIDHNQTFLTAPMSNNDNNYSNNCNNSNNTGTTQQKEYPKENRLRNSVDHSSTETTNTTTKTSKSQNLSTSPKPVSVLPLPSQANFYQIILERDVAQSTVKKLSKELKQIRSEMKQLKSRLDLSTALVEISYAESDNEQDNVSTKNTNNTNNHNDESYGEQQNSHQPFLKKKGVGASWIRGVNRKGNPNNNSQNNDTQQQQQQQLHQQQQQLQAHLQQNQQQQQEPHQHQPNTTKATEATITMNAVRKSNLKVKNTHISSPEEQNRANRTTSSTVDISSLIVPSLPGNNNIRLSATQENKAISPTHSASNTFFADVEDDDASVLEYIKALSSNDADKAGGFSSSSSNPSLDGEVKPKHTYRII